MKPINEKIKRVLIDDKRIVFAYLFGSFLKSEDFNDIIEKVSSQFTESEGILQEIFI